MRVAGIAASTSLASTTSRFVLVCVSTTGVAPETVIVSLAWPDSQVGIDRRHPGARQFDALALDRGESGQRERHDVGAGFRSTIRYWPVPSVTTVRDLFDERRTRGFDVHAGQNGARRIPDDACDCRWENADVERRSSAATTKDPVASARIDGLLFVRHRR